MASASVIVNFSAPASSSGRLSVELDTELNSGLTSFPASATVYFLVFTDPVGAEVALVSSAGSLANHSSRQITITENIAFANATTGQLSHVPSGAVTSEWIGKTNGTPVFAGATITLPAAGVGVLACSYQTTAQGFTLSGVTIPPATDQFPVVIAVTGNGSTASLTVQFDVDASQEPKDVTITIKNVCSKEIIPGAVVTMVLPGGNQTQTANAEGKVTFLQVPPGEHPLQVTAAGYIDNTADSLANDSVTL